MGQFGSKLNAHIYLKYMVTTFYCESLFLCLTQSDMGDDVFLFGDLSSSRSPQQYCHLCLYFVCWVCLGVFFFCLPPNRNHTNISAYIQNTAVSFPFEECALLLFYISYINIYKEEFCKWTSIAYMLVRMNSP